MEGYERVLQTFQSPLLLPARLFHRNEQHTLDQCKVNPIPGLGGGYSQLTGGWVGSICRDLLSVVSSCPTCGGVQQRYWALVTHQLCAPWSKMLWFFFAVTATGLSSQRRNRRILCVRMVWKTYRKYWQGTCTESGERYSTSLNPYFICPITKVISVILAAWADVANIYIITNDVALWAENSWLCEARSSFQVSGTFLFAAWQLLKGSPSQPVISWGILGISTQHQKWGERSTWILRHQVSSSSCCKAPGYLPEPRGCSITATLCPIIVPLQLGVLWPQCKTVNKCHKFYYEFGTSGGVIKALAVYRISHK